LMQNVVRGLPKSYVDLVEYRTKRDFLCTGLRRLGYAVVKPAGAFFLLPRAPILDDLAFVNELKKYRVLTVPGSLYQAPGYFRISYCVDMPVLAGSLEGFKKAFKG
jgi:aspartate aminotransferase